MKNKSCHRFCHEISEALKTLRFIAINTLVRVPSIAFSMQRNPIKCGVPLFFVFLKSYRPM